MMEETNKSYRIHADTFNNEHLLNVNIKQDYDIFEILSLKLSQKNAYKLYESNYGVIVGRVMANGGFGIPNAKISIFIKVSDKDNLDNEKSYLYPYLNSSSNNKDGIRYNLLPNDKVNDCHQNVGTFPNKRMVLDNDVVLEIFDEYWKYTTVTNQAGDYMLFGVPKGNHKLHVDIDLSDIGVLSQRPRDMVYKGYNINQFESPNKFKTSTNLDSLAQIYTQDKGIYVYPFWGDSEAAESGEINQEIAVTRADIQIQYQFEPTCVFMGSIVTDTNANALGKNCVAYKNLGKMSDLVTGEGSIEMIRKTLNGQIEEMQIKGTRLIDGDGVWCYQIPMNLDYVTTDEYGNMVQTDDPTKGIPTRANVRFRISLDDSPNDATNRKRCKFLVPNNPQINYTQETDPEKMSEFDKKLAPDYDFGSATWDESFRDLFWNKVYSVKSYVPRLQKGIKAQQRKCTGIKMTNHYGSNNAIPYNNVNIKLTLIFRLLCVITKIFIYLVTALNTILSTISLLPCAICRILRTIGKIPLVGWVFKQLAKPFCAMVIKCIKIDQGFCDDGINNYTYFPGCYGCAWDETRKNFTADEDELIKKGEKEPEDRTEPACGSKIDYLMTCVENDLAQENEVTSFDFYNDWINGLLYAPLWFRYMKKKKSFLFGLIKLKAKDQWCSANSNFGDIKIFQPCSLTYQAKSGEESYKANNGETVNPFYDVTSANNPKCFEAKSSKMKCSNKTSYVPLKKGIVVNKETILKQTVYYYKPIEYIPAEAGQRGMVITLFATDIILLGSLTDCDLDGTPQFFNYLEATTFNMPTDILFTDNEITVDEDGAYDTKTIVESTGADWGNYSSEEQCGSKKDKRDGGLFYGIGCATIETMGKSCVNLSRICELGVNLDVTIQIQNLNNSAEQGRLVADGFISKDELMELDARSMFATMNGNELKTVKDDINGLYRYDFHYLYPESFDGSLYNMMQDRQAKCDKSYRYNYEIERFNKDYYKFRMGSQTRPTYYHLDRQKARMPRYNNSFYFYFGLIPGNTAIDKFYSQFYSVCGNMDTDAFNVKIEKVNNTWCDIENEKLQGGISLTFGEISTPYSVIVRNTTVIGSIDREYVNKSDDVLYIGYGTDVEHRDSDGNEPLSNGTYNITIMDNDGNIVQKIVELEAEYLSFELDGEMSNVDNKTLMASYNNNCDLIRKAKVGGKIKVNNVSVDNVLMCGKGNNCTEQREYTIKLSELSEERDGAGNIIIKETPFSLTDEEIKTGILEICQGDRNFKVTVIELCNGVESGNKVEQIVYVGEPGKFKMLINGVDYDIIQNFHTGYDNPKQMNSGKFKGWDRLGQINNTFYTWPESVTNLAYDLKGTVNNNTGEIYTEKEIQEEIIKAKEDIVVAVKQAFWMTCKNSTSEVTLNGEFGKPIILYQIAYGKEVLVEDSSQESGFKVEIQDIDVENTQYVFDIEVPTLLPLTNQTGTIVGSYGKLNPEKKPYFVAAFSNYTEDDYNKSNPRRPIKAEVNDNKTFFGIHLIDKIFEIKFISWAWVKDLHIYKVFKPEKNDPESSTYTVGNYGGFLQGNIYNGITKRIDNKNKFQSIICGNVIPEYEDNTPVEYEDALPTERKILGPAYETSRFECLTKEGIMRLPYSTSTFDIDDYSSCGLSVDIFGRMSVRISNAYADKVNNINKLKVSTLYGNESDMRYVLIDAGNSKYPFPMFDPCTGTIYKNDVTQENIEEAGIKQVWDDGLGDGEKEHQYVTDGSFEFDGERAVYVVAYDNNNCRTLSEVYDFSNVKAVVGATNSVEEYTTTVTGETSVPDSDETTDEVSSGSTNISKYGLTLKFETDQWYVSNYTSTIKVTIGQEGSDNVTSFNGILKGKTVETDDSPIKKICVVEVNKEAYDTLCQILSLPIGKDENLNKIVLVEITDILGVSTRCQIKAGKCEK